MAIDKPINKASRQPKTSHNQHKATQKNHRLQAAAGRIINNALNVPNERALTHKWRKLKNKRTYEARKAKKAGLADMLPALPIFRKRRRDKSDSDIAMPVYPGRNMKLKMKLSQRWNLVRIKSFSIQHADVLCADL